MNKNLNGSWWLVLLLVLGLGACGDKRPVVDPPPPPKDVCSDPFRGTYQDYETRLQAFWEAVKTPPTTQFERLKRLEIANELREEASVLIESWDRGYFDTCALSEDLPERPLKQEVLSQREDLYEYLKDNTF